MFSIEAVENARTFADAVSNFGKVFELSFTSLLIPWLNPGDVIALEFGGGIPCPAMDGNYMIQQMVESVGSDGADCEFTCLKDVYDKNFANVYEKLYTVPNENAAETEPGSGLKNPK